MAVKLDSGVMLGFVNRYLRPRFDEPVEIPEFHPEMWDICLSGKRKVALAAPRGHAKSTAITHSLTLALVLFRVKDYVLIVSSTEKKASQFLGDIKTELLENEELRRDFKIKRLIKDAITEIVVEFLDGTKFKIEAIGAEQNPRGIKWNNRRPNFIVCDDIETDEVVINDARRDAFRDWFMRVLIPCLSERGSVVIVGTILHMDSLLYRLLKNKSWTSKLYKAHAGFDDFSDLLWPQQHTEKALREKRQDYIDEGNAEGYAQEYLNDPTANNDAFFTKKDFLPLEDEQRALPTLNYAAVDLAISEQDKRAYTVITVGGLTHGGKLLIKHVLRERMDASQIIDAMFDIQRLYDIQLWKVEKGQIMQTLMGELYSRMNKRGIYLNVVPGVPTKDKRSRARAIQARMRAGGVYFDKHAPWYPAFEQELLSFPKGMYKDQVDSISWLGIAINELAEGPTAAQLDDEAYAQEKEQSDYHNEGQDATTGY